MCVKRETCIVAVKGKFDGRMLEGPARGTTPSKQRKNRIQQDFLAALDIV